MSAPQWHQDVVKALLDTTPIHTGEVHAMDTSAHPAWATYELLGTQITMDVPETIAEWQEITAPNLPWAEDHFNERVGGYPLNPAPSHEWWPFAQRGNAQHMKGGAFSHTYPERFWPKYAGLGNQPVLPVFEGNHHRGIRFNYGDLSDLVDILVKNPLSRQAYLPVWFPEDLMAAVKGERVPCTLGYHFLIRDRRLHCWYTMRSCDALRYLRDDVYMAGRLMQWVVNEWCTRLDAIPGRMGEYGMLGPGNLTLNISSLHAFVGDRWMLEKIAGGTA